eukprot:Nk52_evm1s1971 gene=Nk52_evmTU1s1971
MTKAGATLSAYTPSAQSNQSLGHTPPKAECMRKVRGLFAHNGEEEARRAINIVEKPASPNSSESEPSEDYKPIPELGIGPIGNSPIRLVDDVIGMLDGELLPSLADAYNSLPLCIE